MMLEDAMKSRSNRWMKLVMALGAVAAASISVDGGRLHVGPAEAHAIIGRPLTPFSYAGVARRTVRRSAIVGAPVAAAVVAPVVALPPGCVQNGAVSMCGATTYKAVYDGPNVVYVQQ
jgi:hypothetical protein